MTDRSSWGQAVIFFLVGGLGLAFGQGHWPNGLALLLGIVFWIRFCRVAHPPLAVPLLAVANVLVWEWAYAGMVPMPTPIRIGMFTGISFVMALLFLADRWANLRLNSLLATLVLPCGWVAFDLASARFSPGGTWASVAYTFSDHTIFAQLASLVGWTGITFVVVWLAAAVNWIWDRRSQGGSAYQPGLIAIAVVAFAVLGFGVYRLSTGNSGQLVRVACIVAPNTFNDEYLDDVYTYTRGIKVPESSTLRARERIEQSMEEHFELVETALDLDPDFIVWPEANAVLTLSEEPVWIKRAQQIAIDNQVFIGMGLIIFRPGTGKGTFNKFVLVDPAGKVVMDTLKATQVPGSLNTKGDGILPVVESDFGRLSSAICFDLDFPHVIAPAGREKIDLFFAPSNDWEEVVEIHAQMARMRAIEQGFALVRPTKDGTTLMTDSTGRTVASMTSLDNRTALLVDDLRVGHRLTLYSMIGDSFSVVCALGFLLILGFTGLKKTHAAALG